jgi:hypothetical protein
MVAVAFEGSSNLFGRLPRALARSGAVAKEFEERT